MTLAQWQALKVGDIVVDHCAHNAQRTIYSVKRISGTRGQRSHDVRVAITCTNLKSSNSRTTIFTSDNLGPIRFDFVERAP